jgi:phosphatidylinositol alpha-1,6-mannosyltransferase
VFDHPGPSRVQAWIPGAARSSYAVSILGIDAWHPLAADRVRALAGARAVVAISRTTAERARPFLPSGCRAEVIHPGLERALRGGDPDRSLCDSLGQGFVAIVARLRASERYKGHEPLFEAWPEVRARVPGARLVVVGDGDDRTRLEERARGLGSGESVTFTGAVSPATLDDIYRRAALVAMPSRDEGFGLVFLEAMEHALPCLALAGTAPGEIIEAGRTGLLVEGGSPAALAAALVELLANPERRREMGREGRRQFLAGFTAEAFERRFEPRLDAWLSEGAG